MGLAKELYSKIPEDLRYNATQLSYGFMLARLIPDMFTSIDIGFHDWCNRSCSYCPVSTDPERHGPNGNILSTEAWERFLAGLRNIDYSGNLEPVHFNEPLLRPDLTFPRLEQAKKALPNCQLFLYTNGDLLPYYADQIAKLSLSVVVGIHSPANLDLLKLLEKGEIQKRFPYFEIKDMRINKLFNRAPNCPPERIWHPESCPNYSWGKNTLVVNPKGNVVTCIQDHDGERVWGNVDRDYIMDIWKQREFWQFREQRRLNQTEGMLKICHACLGT